MLYPKLCYTEPCFKEAVVYYEYYHMKSLNKTENMIFVLLCVLCFQQQALQISFAEFSGKTGTLFRLLRLHYIPDVDNFH